MEFSKYAPVPRNIQEELAKKYQEQRAARKSNDFIRWRIEAIN
jgi:hypothetical protein